MRLSATERIIRESEERDGASENPSRGSGKVVAPLTATTTARDGTGPRGWPMAFEVDVDGLRIEDDEEEEKTQVNTEKVQAALKELRSFDPPPRRAPRNAGASIAAAAAPAPAPAAAPLEPDPLSLLPAVEWVEPPPPLVGDSNPAGSFDLRPRRTVGRRGGILIAAATTISVALLLGAWTARWGTPGIIAVKRGSIGTTATAGQPKAAPRPVVSAVIVQAPREAPSGAAPTAAAPTAGAPAVAAPPVAPPVQEAPPANAPAVVTGDSLAPDPTSQAASPDSDEPRQKPSAKGGKSRPSRKATAHKAHRRKSHAAKAKGSHPRTNPVGGVANPPAVRAPASPSGAPRGNTDPDYTLPPTD